MGDSGETFLAGAGKLAALAVSALLVAGACGAPELTPEEAVRDVSAELTKLPSATMVPRTRHTGTLLPSGLVLLTSGLNSSGVAFGGSELYDPITNGPFTVTPPPIPIRYDHTATRLLNDEVLVVGGYSPGSVPAFVVDCRRYNDASATWTQAASLTQGRRYHTATLLPGGEVLVVAGQGTSDVLLSSVATYHPTANAWTSRADLLPPRRQHAAELLTNGDVLVTGGWLGTVSTSEARIFDHAAYTWTTVAPMANARQIHTLTRLPDGSVLAVGYHDSVERYNPTTDSWTTVAPLQSDQDRYLHTATRLPNGCVMVAGGQTGQGGNNTYLDEVELYDPNADAWTVATPLVTPRSRHTATLLDGGVVVLTGGTSTNSSAIDTAERYALRANGAQCTSRCDCLSGFCVDGVCCDAACDQGACDTCLASAGAPADGTCSPIVAGACDDGDACTQGDSCSNGQCVGGTPLTCPESAPCEGPGQCNPANGACEYPSLPNNAPCDDGDACTQTDTCQSGSCMGSNPVTCPLPAPCHLAGTCDPATGLCDAPLVPNDTSCDDGDACTQTDACQLGACVGANPVACPAPEPCHEVAVCDPGTGACPTGPQPDETPCDDGDPCTQQDSCQSGACVSGSPVECPAPGPCEEAGICDVATGACAYAMKPPGTPCPGGVCNAGVCIPDAEVGPASGSGGAGAGSGGGAPDPDEDPGGCACSVPSGSPRGAPYPAALALLAAAWRVNARGARSRRSARPARPR